MKTADINAAASRLGTGRLHREAMAPLPDRLRPGDAGSAYAIQQHLHQRYRDAGRGEVTGYKIGCTTPVMQEYLGIDHPCAGGILADTVYEGHGALRQDRFCRVGVECEIAVRLCRDLPTRDTAYEADEMAPAVGEIMVAMEIVDDRWQDFTTVDTFTLIADDFFGAGCVLGEPVAFDTSPDLGGLRGEMTINGRSVGRGSGSDILGHPLNALAWLASSGACAGGLLENQFVLLGSVVKTHWLAAGDRVKVAIRGLGNATLSLE
jgi:2-keto-4-pentenoate hydratase